jgi:hypothetical protein
MSVLGKAGMTGLKCKETDAKMIPEGATAVRAECSSQGWCLVFETPGGPVTVQVGQMVKAVRLAMRLTGYLRVQERKQFRDSSR